MQVREDLAISEASLKPAASLTADFVRHGHRFLGAAEASTRTKRPVLGNMGFFSCGRGPLDELENVRASVEGLGRLCRRQWGWHPGLLLKLPTPGASAVQPALC